MNDNDVLQKIAKLWFDEMSSNVNIASSMLSIHPDKENAMSTMNNLMDCAFHLDNLLMDYYEE